MSPRILFRRAFVILVFLTFTGISLLSSQVSSSAMSQLSISVFPMQQPSPPQAPAKPDQAPVKPELKLPAETPATSPSGPGTTNGHAAGGTNGQNRTAENGITVGKPKQFDERTLTVMLQDLENKLTRSQFPDPTALYAATGRFAGATATTSSMALSVRGPSTPSIVTTVGSTDKQTSGTTSGEGTEQTETVGGTNPSKTDKATTSNGSTTSNETSNTNQQVTTQGSFAPPTATAPGQTSMFPFQPQFGISAQDLLAEQTSLFYQIANLRLLLDRSITDRVKIKNAGRTTTLETRDQVVVGFQISIDAAHKDAIAEAEITITGPDVSLVSLMPQDKTYNVASVTKDSKAIDMGAVVQFVGVGANIGKTQESLYLVKDTDTVALERAADDGIAKFAWQFRPVLGRRTVEPGSRQVYALISMRANAERDLKVTAVTKWRRFDRKAKTVGAPVNRAPERIQYQNAVLAIGQNSTTEQQLKPFISTVEWSDVGNGQVLAVVEGDGFTPGTQIVLGNNVLDSPEKGLTIANEKRLIVVTQGQLLVQSPSPPKIVGRYGTTDFLRGECLYDRNRAPSPAPSKCSPPFYDNDTPYSDLLLKQPDIKARDAQTFEVTLKLEATAPFDIRGLFDRHRPVVVIGGKVFGLSDAPFIARNFDPQQGPSKSVELTFVTPAEVLLGSKTLTFKEFLWDKGQLTTDLKIPSAFSVTGVVTLGSNGEKTQLAITGGGFTDDVRVQVGDTVFAVKCDKTPSCPNKLTVNTPTVITLSPTKAQIKDVKQILVMQGTAQPRSLALAPPPPATPTAKILSPKQPLVLDEGDSFPQKFEGINFESIQKVTFEGNDLAVKPDPDDKTVLWVEMSGVITGKKGKNKRIVFVMKDDKEVPFQITVR